MQKVTARYCDYWHAAICRYSLVSPRTCGKIGVSVDVVDDLPQKRSKSKIKGLAGKQSMREVVQRLPVRRHSIIDLVAARKLQEQV
ncbi:hypothetical protein VTO42DRAFT_8625 [Malbranchea cinnamomea]